MRFRPPPPEPNDVIASRPPRLVLRFAVYSGLCLALAGAAIVLVVRQLEQQRSEQAALQQARIVAQFTADRLVASDFRRSRRPAREQALTRLFSSAVLGYGTVRADLYDLRGRLAWSTSSDRSANADRALLAAAARGTITSDVGSVATADGAVSVLRAYAPASVAGKRAGVVVLMQEYAPIAKASRDAVFPILIVLESTLVLLYVMLLPLLGRVTRRLRRQVDAIKHQALHDSLTGLPNRSFFSARVAELLAERAGLAVLCVDLDGFKEINDTLGHSQGDVLLCELASRLVDATEPGDALARLGGDEFGIVTHASDPMAVLAIANRLRAAVASPFEIAGVSLEVQASIGAALAPRDGTSGEQLVRNANIAMYAAKAARQPLLYSPDQDGSSPDRLALASDLRTAIRENTITVYYQPQIDATTRAPCGVEALARWIHPERGFVPPDEFVPVAESSGLMRDLTRCVLQQSLEQCRAWIESGTPVKVAVNISPRDLVDTRLPDEIRALLDETGVDPSCLQLEVTESTLLTDRVRSEAVLDQLTGLGLKIAIDDFGTGYSSLGQLKNMPVDVLKIDRSFVFGLLERSSDAVIVRSTIDLAHSLGLTVVAEGVESEALLDRLTELGCDVAQGYHIGRPAPADEVTAWLRSANAAAGRTRQTLKLLPTPPARPSGGESADGGPAAATLSAWSSAS